MRAENPTLTEIEAIRWEKYQLNLLDTWTLAYNRHERGLIASQQWKEWYRYFTELFRTGGERLSKNQWEELKYGYGDKFWLHVSQVLF